MKIFFAFWAVIASIVPAPYAFAGSEQYKAQSMSLSPPVLLKKISASAPSLPTWLTAEEGDSKKEGFQYVYSITYAPSNPQIVYFSTDTTGVWRSEDAGLTWNPIFNGFTSNGACSVLVDPVNADIVYAAGYLGFMGRKESEPYEDKLQGIYRTTDGGKNWKLVFRTNFYTRPGKGTLFAFDSSSATKGHTPVIYAASSDDGLLRSADGGATWEKKALKVAESDLKVGELYDIKELPRSNAPTDPKELILATSTGLFKISGTTAVQLGKELPSPPLTVAVTPADPSLILVALGEKGIYRSTDAGLTFTETDISSEASTPQWLYRKLQGANFTEVALSPVNPDIAYAKTNKLGGTPPFYSIDGGKNWSISSTSQDAAMSQGAFYFSSQLAPHPTDAKEALCVSNGRARILHTLDGGKSWQHSSEGFTGGLMSSMAFPSSTEIYLALVDHGLRYSNDNGKSFTEIPIQKMFGAKTCGSLAVRNDTILVSLGHWQKRGIAVSQDRGKSWTYNDQFMTGRGIAFIHPSEAGVMAIGNGISKDGGKTWGNLGNAATGTLTLHVAQENKKSGRVSLIALGEDGKNAQLYRSDNLGQTWSKLGSPIKNSAAAITKIVEADGKIFASTHYGVAVLDISKTSVAEEWRLLSPPPKDAMGKSYVSTIAVSPDKPSTLWIGRRSPGYGKGLGVYYSTDVGASWQHYAPSGLPLFSINSIEIDKYTGMVYIGTWYGTYTIKPN